jgi:hypothetical protein
MESRHPAAKCQWRLGVWAVGRVGGWREEAMINDDCALINDLVPNAQPTTHNPQSPINAKAAESGGRGLPGSGGGPGIGPVGEEVIRPA